MSLENTVVVLWLQFINPGLPMLVKQKYGAELRNKTIASIKPEISQALDSLLDELKSVEESKVFRAFTPQLHRPKSKRECCLCKAAGRSFDSHFLSKCKWLPDGNRRALGRSRLVQELNEDDDDQANTEEHTLDQLGENPLLDIPTHQVRRVHVVSSPHIHSGHTLLKRIFSNPSTRFPLPKSQ